MTFQQTSSERADRKRTLGVLAQRRYRQRKKDELRRLQNKVTDESAANPQAADPGSSASWTSQSRDICDEATLDSVFTASDGADAAATMHLDPFWHRPCMPFDDDPMFSDQQLLDINADAPAILPLADSTAPKLPDNAIPPFQFLDHRLLQIPELDLMATANVFAKLLRCEDAMWSLTTSRTLDVSLAETEALPLSFRPTDAQRRIMHHPIFDLLPWSSVRTKLICTFAQRSESRPPVARDEMALMRFVNDLDDSAEGLRVYGEDRCDCDNWEVGQQVLDNWWWAFDVSIIVNSNKLRALRGAPRLVLGAP